jgi:hypothetical protein
MINRILILLFMVVVHTTFGQNPGYFGKKNVIDFSVNFQNPSFSNIRAFLSDDSKLFALDGEFLSPKSDRLDWGFRFNYTRPLKRSFAIGLEFGYDYFSVQRRYKQSANDYAFFYFQKTDVTSMSIMPKIEFTTDGGLLPMGISHQLGFGVRMIKPVEKDYNVSYLENYISSNNSDLKIPIYPSIVEDNKYVGNTIKGYTLMYAINLRSPLSKSLFLNYGIRYTLNFMGKPPYKDYTYVSSAEDINLSEGEFKEIVRYRKQMSFIQGFVGLSFAF